MSFLHRYIYKNNELWKRILVKYYILLQCEKYDYWLKCIYVSFRLKVKRGENCFLICIGEKFNQYKLHLYWKVKVMFCILFLSKHVIKAISKFLILICITNYGILHMTIQPYYHRYLDYNNF